MYMYILIDMYNPVLFCQQDCTYTGMNMHMYKYVHCEGFSLEIKYMQALWSVSLLA